MPVLAEIVAASPQPFWLDRPKWLPSARPAIVDVDLTDDVDVLVVGAGLTGLWAGFEAARDGRRALVVDGGTIGSGATGRSGGFINASITHGIANGHARWPEEMGIIVDLQRALWQDTLDLIGDDTGVGPPIVEPVGKLTVAVREHEVGVVERGARLLRRYGEDVEQFDEEELRRRVASPTYRGGYHLRSGNGLCDPVRLVARVADLAEHAGVVVVERSPVHSLRRSGAGAMVTFADGRRLRTRSVLLCTNAARPLLRRLRAYVAPVYDHVIVTEPLSSEQWRSIGWNQRIGITDAGNQFHYYRPTPDGRILFGGWEATYHFGGGVHRRHEVDRAVHTLLHRHLVTTFPALDGVAITNAWGGAVDSTSRFTPTVHAAWDGRVGWAVGFTGLGIGASRFAALAALDLLDGRSTARTCLSLVRCQPVPFPPEPLRWTVINITKRALVREDETGRRGRWLRLLDRLGVGFDT